MRLLLFGVAHVDVPTYPAIAVRLMVTALADEAIPAGRITSGARCV